MTLDNFCTLYREGDLIRARYDLQKAPECSDIQNELVAFIVNDRAFLHPELSTQGGTKARELLRQHNITQTHRLEYGTETICAALEADLITPEEAITQVFAQRAGGYTQP